MTCKDCIYFEICDMWVVDFECKKSDCCDDFKDKSLFIELPCKVGDTVYVVPTAVNRRTEITKMKCLGFMIGGPCNVANCSDDKNKLYQPSFNEFGKTVFLTREEAEKALKEMK